MRVKEIFGPTIQGEGIDTGKPAIFIRFAGCNMWSGKPEDKEKSLCPFCDTDFHGGSEFTPKEIFIAVKELMKDKGDMSIVFSGGEPLLQDEEELRELLTLFDSQTLFTQLETNGTIDKDVVSLFDDVTLSPKLPPNKLKIKFNRVNCLKLLYPHPNPNITPESFNEDSIRHMDLFLQPIDACEEKQSKKNLDLTLKKLYELGYPWRLSLQTHKFIGVP